MPNEGTVIHAGAAAGWAELALVDQLANVGSEVERAIRAHGAGNVTRWEHAQARALELFDLTAADPRWRDRAGERFSARARNSADCFTRPMQHPALPRDFADTFSRSR